MDGVGLDNALNVGAAAAEGRAKHASQSSRRWPLRRRPIEAASTGERNTTRLTQAQLATPLPAPDRFQPSALSPIDRRTALRLSRMGGGGKGEKAKRGKARPMRLFDWILLGLEAAAAIIVAWVAFQYIFTVYFDTAPRRLSPPPAATPTHKVVSSGPTHTPAPRPTATATATRFVEVLPPLVGANGTHTSDTGDGLAGGPPPTATRVPTTATPTVDPALLLPTRLRIPIMSLDSPVHEVHVNMGTWEVSEMQIGHHEGSGNPGEVGNVALAGHRDINSALFRDLDRLKPGDAIYVSNGLREYRYIVDESLVVSPSHTEVMDPTDDKRVTLITCTPIGLATQRLVVVAKLDEGR